MIEKPKLKLKDALEVSRPEYKDGTEIIGTKSADMNNSETDLNQTASSENLSAKYKYPRVSQEIPAEGQGQYQSPK